MAVIHSRYTAQQIIDSIGKNPIVRDGNFWTWDIQTSQYVDSGYAAGIPDYDGAVAEVVS